ncbi:TetR/AcrR family transcriptional regulator [Pontixanthobacter aquaemixtae]|uniref:TetR family transcriptional regulator n=1 Tax=Pontixanthobacter aquaemixtae TaxID=1958940 RepID=A0A844ZRL6_9SPHN|nr:TetR/AcrR family transcriptional regulator [Pontixanthobacter aquaemixtae]MXO89962.1 TetR family transcriptional regulator [Pontixanthobacter aquaemixtae]
MTRQGKRRARDPIATRADILDAALTLLAKDGLEAVSLSGVATQAGVNRGTAYQHFETRESLLAAALQLVSERMFEAVFGDSNILAERDVRKVDMVETTENLAIFAMENTELCRIWLLQLLAMPDPSRDPFWREYSGSIARFAETDLAKPGIDVDVWSLISLAGQFLWPVWSRSQARSEEEKEQLVQRFTNEMLRLSVHGAVDPEKNPSVMARLAWSKGRGDREKRKATN